MNGEIELFFEDIPEISINTEQILKWILQTVELENKVLNHLNYIFCSDEYLHKVNVEYLSHDYYTDVITFDTSDEEKEIEGDIFISTERVQDNADSLDTSFQLELRRVIIHGLLHLVGYNDKTNEEQDVMREKENAYLSLPHFNT